MRGDIRVAGTRAVPSRPRAHRASSGALWRRVGRTGLGGRQAARHDMSGKSSGISAGRRPAGGRQIDPDVLAAVGRRRARQTLAPQWAPGRLWTCVRAVTPAGGLDQPR